MKTKCLILAAAFVTTQLHAEFRTWTRNDGKTAELELVGTVGEDDAKEGRFKMRNGKFVNLPIAQLSESDAELVKNWKPEAPSEAAGEAEGRTSVFDKALDGNLVALKGKSLKAHRDFAKPAKYYMFYYTASWCGPCQKFTPSLVEFYEKNKSEDFEIILVTSDQDEDAMEEYAAEKKMTWPHLKLSRAEKFKEEFKHPGGGIPNLVLTDLEGNLLKTSYEGSKYLGPAVVMDHLASLLK